MNKTIQEELQELSDIPILESEVMWIARVTSEEQSKELQDSDDSETSM